MNKKVSKIITTIFEGNGTQVDSSLSMRVDNDFIDRSARVDSSISFRLFSRGDDYVIDLEASRSMIDIKGESDSELVHRQILINKELVESTISFALNLISIANSGKGIRIVNPDEKVDDSDKE